MSEFITYVLGSDFFVFLEETQISLSRGAVYVFTLMFLAFLFFISGFGTLFFLIKNALLKRDESLHPRLYTPLQIATMSLAFLAFAYFGMSIIVYEDFYDYNIFSIYFIIKSFLILDFVLIKISMSKKVSHIGDIFFIISLAVLLIPNIIWNHNEIVLYLDLAMFGIYFVFQLVELLFSLFNQKEVIKYSNRLQSPFIRSGSLPICVLDNSKRNGIIIAASIIVLANVVLFEFIWPNLANKLSLNLTCIIISYSILFEELVCFIVFNVMDDYDFKKYNKTLEIERFEEKMLTYLDNNLHPETRNYIYIRLSIAYFGMSNEKFEFYRSKVIEPNYHIYHYYYNLLNILVDNDIENILSVIDKNMIPCAINLKYKRKLKNYRKLVKAYFGEKIDGKVGKINMFNNMYLKAYVDYMKAYTYATTGDEKYKEIYDKYKDNYPKMKEFIMSLEEKKPMSSYFIKENVIDVDSESEEKIDSVKYRCPHCQKVTPHMSFCMHCGKKLDN